MKSFTLDGKRYRLDPRIPAYAIERHIATFHVGRSDADIRAAIEPDPAKGWSPALIETARAYAVHCHRKNQELYRFVMAGM